MFKWWVMNVTGLGFFVGAFIPGAVIAFLSTKEVFPDNNETWFSIGVFLFLFSFILGLVQRGLRFVYVKGDPCSNFWYLQSNQSGLVALKVAYKPDGKVRQVYLPESLVVAEKDPKTGEERACVGVSSRSLGNIGIEFKADVILQPIGTAKGPLSFFPVAEVWSMVLQEDDVLLWMSRKIGASILEHLFRNRAGRPLSAIELRRVMNSYRFPSLFSTMVGVRNFQLSVKSEVFSHLGEVGISEN